MDKNYSFYRGYLKRELAVDGEPGLLAATEVVQAVCDAGFQRNGFSMKSYPSSPHCYFKFAKTPKEGMYKLRAVKKTNMTTLDILIDTRIHPCFVMIEKNTDWQDEKEEVVDTVELGINIGAEIFNWHIDLKEYRADSTEHLEEFISALSYMKDIEDMHEKHNSTVQIGQLILKVNGNNYYNDDMKMKEHEEDELKEERKMEIAETQIGTIGRKKLSLQKLACAIENSQKYFWGNSSYGVVFCLCRDDYGMEPNKSAFENLVVNLPYTKKLSFVCTENTIANAFQNNPIFCDNVNNWDSKNPMARIIKLRDELRKQLNS